MKFFIPFSVVSLCLLITASAGAYPTFLGQTGGAMMPTADVLPVDHLDLAVDGANTQAASRVRDSFPVRARLVYGIGSGIEVGAGARIQRTLGEANNMYSFTGKFQLPVSPLAVHLAFGGLYAMERQRYNNQTTHSQQLYLLGTRAFTISESPLIRIIASGGLSGYRTSTGALHTTGVRPHAALETALPNQLRLLVEHQRSSLLGHSGVTAATLRVPLTSDFSLQVGYSDAFFLGLNFGYTAMPTE